MYMYKGVFSRIVYTTIWLMNTSALSGEEVALIWKITTRKYHSYWEEFQEIVQDPPITTSPALTAFQNV